MPDADTQCACGQTKTRIGASVSEKLEYEPASFVVIETVRAKYACPQCHDGVDNDSDGDIDEADSYCLTAAGVREGRIACGIGFELALIVQLLGAAARRRRAAAARVAAARRR